jgi:hypothetical protein
MPKYEIKMKIDFIGTIEAESEAEAEELAWTKWGETADAEIQYDGVYSIDVQDVTCAGGCGESEDDCECEEEEDEEEDEEE